MAGLLNTLKKNWRGLLDEVQAAPESLRALAQPAAAQQFDAALRKGGTIDKEKAVQMAMDVLQTTPMGVMGKIVYHGSPHKFDKFDMSKIGTGEGAQAYGHGLYFAESPAVADIYSGIGPVLHNIGEATFDGIPASKLPWLKDNTPQELAFRVIGTEKSVEKGSRALQRMAASDPEFAAANEFLNANKSKISWLSARPELSGTTPNLYKVDIPDESIPRMLDWDNGGEAFYRSVVDDAGRSIRDRTGKYWDMIKDDPSRLMYRPGDVATMALRQQGIPGIRYLDGGSRTAGEGTSNFVLFDDQLARILERNGQATGLQPWASGEWKGLLE